MYIHIHIHGGGGEEKLPQNLIVKGDAELKRTPDMAVQVFNLSAQEAEAFGDLNFHSHPHNNKYMLLVCVWCVYV